MLKNIYLASSHEASGQYTVDQLAEVLDVIEPRGVHCYAAARTLGFDPVSAACASFGGIIASPQSMGELGAAFEAAQPELFARLASGFVDAVSPRNVKAEWTRLRAIKATPAIDSLTAFAPAIHAVASKEVSEFVKSKGRARLKTLLENRDRAEEEERIYRARVGSTVAHAD
jgi:hypothetical protein